MINVAICTPSIGQMKTRYTTSLMRMLLHYQKTPVLGREEDEARFLSYHVIEGSMVGSAREEMVDDVLKMEQTTHLLFIDEDMGFRQDCLNKLLARQQPFVSANYRMKIPPCYFTARKADDSDWLPTNADSFSLEEALFTGFGFSLIERQVLEAIKKPRFSNVYYDKYGTYSTEDKTFCALAKEAGFPVHVDHDVSKLVYHVGSYSYSWDDEFPAYKKVPYAERKQIKT
jgi:hypothetical protein